VPQHVKKTEMLAEYDFSKGVRGKYIRRYEKGSNVVVLSPDLAKVFRTSQSVNKALRSLVQAGRRNKRRVTV